MNKIQLTYLARYVAPQGHFVSITESINRLCSFYGLSGSSEIEQSVMERIAAWGPVSKSPSVANRKYRASQKSLYAWAIKKCQGADLKTFDILYRGYQFSPTVTLTRFALSIGQSSTDDFLCGDMQDAYDAVANMADCRVGQLDLDLELDLLVINGNIDRARAELLRASYAQFLAPGNETTMQDGSARHQSKCRHLTNEVV